METLKYDNKANVLQTRNCSVSNITVQIHQTARGNMDKPANPLFIKVCPLVFQSLEDC